LPAHVPALLLLDVVAHRLLGILLRRPALDGYSVRADRLLDGARSWRRGAGFDELAAICGIGVLQAKSLSTGYFSLRHALLAGVGPPPPTLGVGDNFRFWSELDERGARDSALMPRIEGIAHTLADQVKAVTARKMARPGKSTSTRAVGIEHVLEPVRTSDAPSTRSAPERRTEEAERAFEQDARPYAERRRHQRRREAVGRRAPASVRSRELPAAAGLDVGQSHDRSARRARASKVSAHA